MQPQPQQLAPISRSYAPSAPLSTSVDATNPAWTEQNHQRPQRAPRTVLICDDSPLARESLRRTVAAIPGVDRVVVAASGEDALLRWNAERPILTLMDVRMPGLGGVEATRRLLATHPGAGVMMMTMAEDVDGVARAVNAGACGYIVKDVSREELMSAVRHQLDRAAPLASTGRRAGLLAGSPPTLTEREMQVLAGMGRGRSNNEIGRELYLSEDTIKTHARRLFRKVGAADRAQAVALGFRWGMLR